jgi:hypothetical protein
MGVASAVDDPTAAGRFKALVRDLTDTGLQSAPNVRSAPAHNNIIKSAVCVAAIFKAGAVYYREICSSRSTLPSRI